MADEAEPPISSQATTFFFQAGPYSQLFGCKIWWNGWIDAKDTHQVICMHSFYATHAGMATSRSYFDESIGFFMVHAVTQLHSHPHKHRKNICLNVTDSEQS